MSQSAHSLISAPGLRLQHFALVKQFSRIHVCLLNGPDLMMLMILTSASECKFLNTQVKYQPPHTHPPTINQRWDSFLQHFKPWCAFKSRQFIGCLVIAVYARSSNCLHIFPLTNVPKSSPHISPQTSATPRKYVYMQLKCFADCFVLTNADTARIRRRRVCVCVCVSWLLHVVSETSRYSWSPFQTWTKHIKCM